MATPSNDQITIQIILDAQQANAKIKELTQNMSKASISASQLQKTIQTIANTTGQSFRDVGQRIKEFQATEVDASGVSVELGNNIKNAFSGQVDQAVRNLDKGISDATKSGNTFNNVLKLIRGTLVAIGVFRVFQFIDDSIRKAITTAREFEQSLYRIQNLERILSQAGTEISLSGLKKGIEDIKKLLPIFSKADITQQVSLIGIMTKELGYTEDQIIDLAKAIGVLNVRSAEQEDLLTTTNKVLTALVAPTGKGIASLGISLSESTIEAEALSEGLLKVGQSAKDLTNEEKNLVKLNIVLKSTGQEVLNIGDYLNTNTARIEQNSAAWEDFLANLGQLFIPLVPALTGIIGIFDKVTTTVKQLVTIGLANLAAALTAIIAIAKTFGDNFVLIGRIIQAVLTGNFSQIDDLIKQMVKNITEIPQAIGTAWRSTFDEFTNRFFPSITDGMETATEAANGLANAIQSISEIEGFDKLIDDLTKLQEKLRDTQSEFDLDQARAAEDFAIKITRIQEDYAIKRQTYY